jgi:signal transduction histidine kinase
MMRTRRPLPFPGSVTARRLPGEGGWWRYSDRFWFGVMAALLALASVSTLNADPHIVATWNGPITLALMLAYGAWFYDIMLRRPRSDERVAASAPRRLAWISAGLLLTVALVVLHREFTSIIFADIAISAFAIDGALAAVPIVGLALLFLYGTGDLQQPRLDAIAGDLLAVIAMVAVIYSLVTALRGRIARDRLIAELREAHEQLRAASAQEVELAALRERNRLAREMHDSLGHALVLIAVKIEAAQRLSAVDPDRATAEWDATKALVRSTMAELRTSLAGLRMPALEERPFRAALEDLVASARRNAGLDITLSVRGNLDSLSRPVEEALYRVAQEGLANVAAHARARHAWLTLTVSGESAELTVEDDGVGLGAVPPAPGGHYGVTGMRERIEERGGCLALAPRRGGGTRLSATIPLTESIDVRDPHPVG